MLRLGRTFIIALCFVLFSFSLSFAVSVVSPSANAVIYSDSILVSVKVTEKISIKVTVYEAKDKDELGNAVAVDVSKMNTDDVALIASYRLAAENTEAPALSNGARAKKYSEVIFSPAVNYTNNGDVGFYTKQLSGVKPGLYRVQVDSLGENGEVISTVSSMVAVREKDDKVDQNIFEGQTTSILQYVQNMLRKLFR